MRNPVIRGFSNVWRFGGRDTRSEFWPYAGAVVVLYVVVFCLAQVALLADPPRITIGQIFQDHAFVVLAVVALLAAAIARRLHDSGLSSFWGLPPLPFLIYSSAAMVRLGSQFQSGAPDDLLLLSILISNALYLAVVILLIVLLVRRSTPGPNRFG